VVISIRATNDLPDKVSGKRKRERNLLQKSVTGKTEFYASEDRVEMVAGLPLAMELLGMFVSNTAPAPMTEWLPMVVPGPIKAWAEIQT